MELLIKETEDGEIKLTSPKELPSITIPCESEESLLILMVAMNKAGMFNEGNSFKVENVSDTFFDELNKRVENE